MRFLSTIRTLFLILVSFKPKIFIMAHPTHPNLGDQAQLMCTESWLKDNFPKHHVFNIGTFTRTLCIYKPLGAVFYSFLFLCSYCILKLKVRKSDLFIGHSGYLMIDHHQGWKMFTDVIRFFPNNRVVIFPQTINFYTPFIRKYVSEVFNKSRNVVLMCRDEVSFKNAETLFPNIKIMLMPDIVTTLVGRKRFENDRNGVLFCLRNDLEAFYKEKDLNDLIIKFQGKPIKRIDTTLDVTDSYMRSHRNELIWSTIEDFSKFQVVITDRYHGTIFAVIAGTPVVVLNSTDHKLSSGVKWFPEEFSDMVFFANDLEEAYSISSELVSKKVDHHRIAPYFWDNYYKGLKDVLF